MTTAAIAVRRGPEGFNAWIDAQVYGQRRARRTRAHKARMGRFWWLGQPAINFVRTRPREAALLVSLALGLVMLWKVSTR